MLSRRDDSAPPFEFFHVSNGGARRRIEAAILSGLGVRPGVSDLVLYWRRPEGGMTVAGVEVKTEEGETTKTQDLFRDRLVHLGGVYVVVRGVDELQRHLRTWGLLR